MEKKDMPDNGNGREIDARILDLLKENARLSYTDIGRMVGISRVAVKNRIENLEASGVIRGYHVVTDETAGPNGVHFYLNIETVPEKYFDVIDILARDRRIRQIFTATGMCNLHVRGFAGNMADVAVFARTLYNNTSGIKRLEWNIITSVLKDTEGGIEYVRPEDADGEPCS